MSVFRNKTIIILTLFGIFSFGILSYFYMTQRSFIHNQKAFFIHLDNIDNSISDLTSETLKNSLFIYNSQDKIANDYDTIEKELHALQNAKILHNKPYKILKYKIDTDLQQQIKYFLQKVQLFLIANAAVKNSTLFLSSYIERASYIKQKHPLLYAKAVSIFNHFQNTRRTQDLDFFNTLHYKLHSNIQDKKVQQFIKKFNLHTSFLTKKIPLFITVTNDVLNNNIDVTLHTIKKEFQTIVLNDFLFFDQSALVIAGILMFYFFIALYLFIQYQKINHSLNYALIHDQLTNLYNRNSFIRDTQKTKVPQTILLLNIDAFKEINDIYGNDFGNKVLIEFTQFLKNYFEQTKDVTLYRVGGDEFIVLFQKKDSKEVMKIATNLINAIKHSNLKIDNNLLNLSVSIAINSIPPLLENADLALKIVKKDIDNRVIEYTDNLNLKEEWEKNKQTIEMVKSALYEDRIVPYFQGIVNLQTMKIEKYESLVRLILPSGEVLSPYFFLDTISKTHYYYAITKTMIQKTIKTAQQHPMYRFSINLSMKDIINEEITNTLFELFEQDKQTASRIDIELLETELVEIQNQHINDFIAKVHSYGSKILIDDFGTGYSNFAYLAELHVDTIKIDASITKEITQNPKKLHILKTIANFTKGLQMQNVAEFVETKEVALMLKELNVEYAQGYFFAKPQPQPEKNNEVTQKL